MTIDTKGLSPELEGKALRIFFQDGEIAEIKLVHFDLLENCEFGDHSEGIIYDLMKTNRPEIYKANPTTSAHWADFTEIEKFELVDLKRTTDH